MGIRNVGEGSRLGYLSHYSVCVYFCGSKERNQWDSVSVEVRRGADGDTSHTFTKHTHTKSGVSSLWFLLYRKSGVSSLWFLLYRKSGVSSLWFLLYRKSGVTPTIR